MKMKNLLRFFAVLLSAGIVLSACQKELSSETGTAKGNIVKDANNECLPATPNGIFKKDTVLTNNNYVDITVNFTDLGVYLIKTDTINGYYFKASGVAAVTGNNTVRLIGYGKPIAVSVDAFTVTFNTSTCQFNIIVLSATGGGATPAVFTLGSATGICTATLNGTFTQGASVTGNFATLAVTVQTAGTYTLSTGIINGVTFSNTGFLSAGTTSITLNASGTPTNAGPIFPYPVLNGANTCGFNVPVVAAPAGTAVYTYNCAATTFAGNYQVGTPMNAGNTITAPITVTTGGSYNISTTVNGVTFSKVGTISATPTSQTIILTATGTPAPAAAPSTQFILNGGGGNSCPITIPFTTGGGGPVLTDSISATIDGTFTVFNDFKSISRVDTLGYKLWIVYGDSLNSNASIQFGVGNMSGNFLISPIFYDTNQFPLNAVFADYTTSAGVDYSAITSLTGVTQTNPFKITFTSITPAINPTRVKGTFSGYVRDNSGAGPGFKNITGGYFDLTF